MPTKVHLALGLPVNEKFTVTVRLSGRNPNAEYRSREI